MKKEQYIYHCKSILRRWYEFRIPSFTRVTWRHLNGNPQIRVRMNNTIKTLPECLTEFFTGDNNAILEVNYGKPRKQSKSIPKIVIVENYS